MMFNDRCGLTQAVIEGRKTMTRRIELGESEQKKVIPGAFEVTSRSLKVRKNGQLIMSVPFRYKVSEIVAVAQSYEQAGIQSWAYLSRPEIDGYQIISTHKGWRNKMYVSADLMPHQIRITGIRCERLQDISDAECLKEGVVEVLDAFGKPSGYYTGLEGTTLSAVRMYCNTPREAFAALIDKVSGRGTWKSNPWVVVYEFELVK